MNVIAWLMLSVVGLANGLADTDTITWGGDNSRAGYQTNHNIDPAIVRSSQFDRLFTTDLPGDYGGFPEQIFSQPLVYTPDDTQFVYLATTQNNIYKLDAQTGDIVASRNLHIPFLTQDLSGCLDINPHVGVIGTGVIDPETDTWYFLAKTYQDQSQYNVAQGRPAGRYYFHAIDVNDLSERPNFPVPLEGITARNNPLRSFNGGIHLQRPGLLHVGDWIYAGLGSHCVQYNFTGWVMGWHKETGELVEHFATQGEGVLDEGAGIWMAGGGLAYDGAGSIFFSTGNGYASQLNDIPVSGRDPPTALEEAVVHMTIQEDGSLDLVDFFMPHEKRQLDGADQDLGSSPLQILPEEFSCGDIRRIGVVTGKSGKTWWVNLDHLGGYRNGGVGLDDIIQIYQHENSVYAGAGVYPGEGGYLYINVVRYPTVVFRFSCNNGVPSFTKVAETPQSNSYTLGVSHGTVTSLNGQPGTGLLWLTDVQNPPGQLRIYDAVPDDGELTLLRSWEIGGTTKFTRAVFGDGIMYMGGTTGRFHAFGAPVKSPLNCTTPDDFGTVGIDVTGETQTLSCTALLDVEVNAIALSDDTDYSISDLPTLPLTLSEGESFQFSAAFAPTEIGLLSTDVAIETENSVEGFRTTTSVRLTGTGESEGPSLSLSSQTIRFENVVAGNASVAPNNIVFRNQGNSALTVTEIQYADSINGTFQTFDPSSGDLTIGPFTITDLPSTIAANSGSTVYVHFDPANPGNYSGHVKVSSDGGDGEFTISGRAGPAPVAVLEFQTVDGSGWVPYELGQNFTFGNVTENTSRSLRLRLTNAAPEGGIRLMVSVSKPPFGASGIIRANNQVDLGEGTAISPGESASAVLYCAVPKRQWNMEPYDAHATWSMNTNDPDFNYHVIDFVCNAVSQQAPPLLANGLGRYQYVGCFKENNPGRQLAAQLYGDDENTVAMCIDACAQAGHTYCGMQYHRECWAGPTIPREQVPDINCNYDCSGDINQICGGNGVGDLSGGAYISLFADILVHDGNGTIPEDPVPDPTSSAGPTEPTESTDPPTDPTDPSDPPEPEVNPGLDGYVSIGCYTEPPAARALPYFHVTEAQTVAMCIEACSGNDYDYAGLEYGGECWCANEIHETSVRTADDECGMTCNGNRTEYCGGPSRLNVYYRESDASVPPSSSDSPASSTQASSTVPTPTSEAPTSSDSVSAPPSSTTTTTTSEAPVPTQHKRERVGSWIFEGCYTEGDGVRALSVRTFADDSMTLEACAEFCEGTLYFGTEYGRECYCGNTLNGGSSLAENQDDCDFPCAGDATQFCGAGNRLELYRHESASSGTATTTTSTSTSATDGARNPAPTDPSTTLSAPATTTTPPPTTTTTTTTTSAAGEPPSPTVHPGNEEWVYAGCFSEPEGGRLLPHQVRNDGDEMSIDVCLAECEGYNYGGVEYGRECWCGNELNLAGDMPPEGEVAGPDELVDDEECSFLCPGDRGTFCGAGLRMNLYVLRSLAESEE